MSQNPRLIKEQAEFRTEFLCRVFQKLNVRGIEGKPVEWFDVTARNVLLMRGQTQMGYIARWEIEAVIKELMSK